MPKIVDDQERVFIIEKDDGTREAIAKTPGTMPVYNMLAGGANMAVKPFDPMASVKSPVMTSKDVGMPAVAEAPAAPQQPVVSGNQEGTVAASSPAVKPFDPLTPRMVTTTSSKTQSSSIDNGTQKELDKATSALTTSIMKEQEVKQKALDKQAKELEAQSNYMQQYNEYVKTAELSRQAAIASKLEDVEKVEKQFQEAKIDPSHLWGDEGTGNRILAAVGIALGAIGQALNGKENGAIGIVNAAIQRDIDVQKANIDKMGRAAQMARGGLADFRNILGDVRAAEAAEHLRQLGFYEQKLKEIAASNASAEVKASAQKELSNVEMEKAKFKAQINQTVTINETQTQPMKPLDMAPEAVNSRVLNAEAAANSLIELKEQIQGNDFAGIGAIEGRVTPIMRWLGINDPDQALNQAAVEQALAEKIKAVSGAQSAEPEAKRLAQTMFSRTDSPETFIALLDREIEKFTKQSQEARQYYSGKQALGNSIIKNNFKFDYNFKPASQPKKK